MLRQPIEDANAGTTRTSTVRRQSPTLTDHSAVSLEARDGEDIFQVANATTEVLQGVNKNYQQNAAQTAVMRQGADEGINEIDKANKRSGFMKMLFGEDAGYATALSIATSNKAQNMYLEQLSDIEQHADKTPEEYSKYLDQTVTQSITELYKDDPEAKATAQHHWIDQSRKLAREQAANHLVYTQQQTYAEGVRDLSQQFDEVTMSMQTGRTGAAHTEALADLKQVLQPSYLYVAPDGVTASKQASRNIQLEVLDKQLSNGNPAVWHNLPDNFTDGLTVPQMRKFDGFQQKYDNAQARKGELIVEQGLLATENKNLSGLHDAIQQLEQQQPQLSGSDQSKEKWTEDKRRLANSLDAFMKTAAADSVKQEDMMKYYKARESQDFGAAGQYYSKAAEDGANDAVVMVTVANFNSMEDMEPPKSMGEAINTLLFNPQAMSVVASKAERYGSISKPLAEAVKQNVLNVQPSENGYMTAESLVKMDTMQTLYDKAPGEMRKAVGEDASAMIEITLNNSRQPVKEIQHKRAQYVKNKAIQLSKQELNIPPEQTMGDYVKQQLGDGYLDPSAINYYQERLQIGYKIYDGDTRAAVNYMKQQYKTNNQHWKGKVIVNAGLREGANIPQALNYLESTAGAEALIRTQIPAASDGKAIRSFSELNDVQFRVNPGTEELIISSSQFSYPIVIKEQTFAVLAAKSNAAEQAIQAERIKARNAILEQESQQYWPNPNDKSKRPAGLPELTDAEKVGPTKSW